MERINTIVVIMSPDASFSGPAGVCFVRRLIVLREYAGLRSVPEMMALQVGTVCPACPANAGWTVSGALAQLAPRMRGRMPGVGCWVPGKSRLE
ncbi:hypothetical protein K8S19_01860 [bacterium]|nr:hypothetical protein [bacterium]